MGSSAVVPGNSSATSASVKVPIGSMLIVGVITALLAIGGCAGVLLYLAKKGKLGAASATPAPVVVNELHDDATPLQNVMLETMLVNLADADGHSYLRIGVVLGEEADLKAKKEEKPVPGADAALRDAVLGVLGKKQSAQLLADAGKEDLKKELKIAVNEAVPSAHVRAVYFTDYLVQR
ncbi:flagellar basal body-associated protein FliL [Granulicella cerasi]|uniref:Flagellar protein FliL n=1 Tax=Granulicella cerasi TaxID=741063 RepID=A0ABW1Z400_9BACT|nr:flagellar basal body-associated FliL family protein [Granulicella cerasi]